MLHPRHSSPRTRPVSWSWSTSRRVPLVRQIAHLLPCWLYNSAYSSTLSPYSLLSQYFTRARRRVSGSCFSRERLTHANALSRYTLSIRQRSRRRAFRHSRLAYSHARLYAALSGLISVLGHA